MRRLSFSRRLNTLGGLLAVAAPLVVVTPAKADLEDAQQRLAQALRGEQVRRLGPRVLQRGERLALLLPSDWLETGAPDCIRVVAVGAAMSQLQLRGPEDDDGEATTITSHGGVVEGVRCNVDRSWLAQSSIEMLSPRGVVHLFASHGEGLSPRAFELLPERDPGEERLVREIGDYPKGSTLEQGLARVERQTRARGSRAFERRLLRGAELVEHATHFGLPPGCHELGLLIEPPSANPKSRHAGFDSHLTWAGDGADVASVSSPNWQASYRLCTSEARVIKWDFAGLPAGSNVAAYRGQWDMAPAAPTDWAFMARSQLTWAWIRRGTANLAGDLRESFLTGPGRAYRYVNLTAGACYVAAAAPTHGTASQLSLSVEHGLVTQLDLPAAVSEAATVAFCSASGGRATLHLESQGEELTLLVGLWRVAAGKTGQR